MAQQFVLKGVKELRDINFTGATFDFRVKQDPRGGDTWQIPQWWAKKANNMIYNSCTVIDIVGTNYNLVIPTSKDTQLMVTYDDDVYSIVLSNFNAVERVAVTSKDTKKIAVEYLLPAVSGGAIAKRILISNNTIGDVEITGADQTLDNQTTVYTADVTTQVSPIAYAWSVVDAASSGSAVPSSEAEVVSGGTTNSASIQWKTAGTYYVQCEVSSTDPDCSDTPQIQTEEVTVTAAPTVGTVEVTGNQTPKAETSQSYLATVTGNNVSADSISYKWQCTDQAAQIAVDTANPATIIFNTQGNADVKCRITSSEASDTDEGTLAVAVASAQEIGVVTITSDTTTPVATVADNFQAGISGNAIGLTYLWNVSPNDGSWVINAETAQATDITFNAAGTYHITCKVSSATATPSSVTSSEYDVSVSEIADGFPGVKLSGPTTVNALNTGKNYTSAMTDDSTPAGNTTYQWTATNTDTGETQNNGAVFSTAEGKTQTSQNTQITFVQDGQTYEVRCKWTNKAYANSPKTGMRTTVIDTNADSETS